MTIILGNQTRDVPDEYALRLISQGLAEPFIGEPATSFNAARQLSQKEKPVAEAPAKVKAKPEKESRRDVSANESQNEG